MLRTIFNYFSGLLDEDQFSDGQSIFSFLIRAGDVDHLLDGLVQELGAVVVGSFVVDFFAVAATGDELCTFELLEVVADSRAGHPHHGRQVDDTFFAVAEQPEEAEAVAIAELFEDGRDSLKIGAFRYFIEQLLHVFAVVVGQSDRCHETFLLAIILAYLLAGEKMLIFLVTVGGKP